MRQSRTRYLAFLALVAFALLATINFRQNIVTNLTTFRVATEACGDGTKNATTSRQQPFTQNLDLDSDSGSAGLDGTSSNHVPIPNIVHFVHINAEKSAKLIIPFREFVAIYSAHLYLAPERIYIHTDADISDVSAAKSSSDPYTRAIANLPNLIFNSVDAPEVTSNGIPIKRLAHKSDFIRLDALKKYGGIYLDDDIYVLHDLAPLRRTGYQNIIGQQYNGRMCNAVLLAAPGPENAMLSEFERLSDETFDGQWTTHSLKLLTTLAHEYTPRDNSVLVLPQSSLFSGSWEHNDLKALYQVHYDDEEASGLLSDTPYTISLNPESHPQVEIDSQLENDYTTFPKIENTKDANKPTYPQNSSKANLEGLPDAGDFSSSHSKQKSQPDAEVEAKSKNSPKSGSQQNQDPESETSPELERLAQSSSVQAPNPDAHGNSLSKRDVNATDPPSDDGFIEYFSAPDYAPPESPPEWKKDFRLSYAIHGWHSAIQGDFSNVSDREEFFQEFGGITIDYVMSQSSNFARAVKPAVEHAIDHGILDWRELQGPEEPVDPNSDAGGGSSPTLPNPSWKQ